jgi:hypothetical protein
MTPQFRFDRNPDCALAACQADNLTAALGTMLGLRGTESESPWVLPSAVSSALVSGLAFVAVPDSWKGSSTRVGEA